MLELNLSESKKLVVLQKLILMYLSNAGIAQLVEQFTCNEQVGGSNPLASLNRRCYEYKDC